MILSLNSQIIFFVLPVVFASCCHQDIKESSKPLTNNPEIIGYKEEWQPDPDEAWWKVCIYETLKDWSEESNKK
jgi:hypothetical protein